MTDEGRQPVSGCVICYQEADRIEDCLRSLAFCDEVVVVSHGRSVAHGSVPELLAQAGEARFENAFVKLAFPEEVAA